MKLATSFLTASLLFLAFPSERAVGQIPPPAPRTFRVVPAGGAGGSFLGIGVAEITAARAKALKLPEGSGIEVTRVEEGSPADKAGLKIGDALLQFNGQPVQGMEEFIRMVHDTPSGRHVKLLISRDGATQTLTAVLGYRKQREVRIEAMPSLAPLATPAAVPDFEPPSFEGGAHQVALGIEVESITAQLAEYFGVRNGVLVRTVVKGSPAARAGFRAGDVITKVDGTSIEHPSDVFIAVHAPRTSRTISVSVVRDHHELALSPAVPSDGGEDGDAPPARP